MAEGAPVAAPPAADAAMVEAAPLKAATVMDASYPDTAKRATILTAASG